MVFTDAVDECVHINATAAMLREYLTTEALDRIAPGETTVFILTAVADPPVEELRVEEPPDA